MLQFANFSQTHFLKPLKLNISDLKRICIELAELSKAAQQREIEYYTALKVSPANATEGQLAESQKQFEMQVDAIKKFAHLSMSIEDDSGERRTVVFDQDVGKDFDEIRLPRKILKITFDNAWNYNAVWKKFYFNQIKVELDFSDIKVLDFYPPKKERSCFIEVHGFDETIVLGVVGVIKKSFSVKTLLWTNTLYRYLKYDLLLWTVGIPSILFIQWKSKIGEHLFSEFPLGLQPIGYLATSLLMLIGFRLFYNYSKWLFPYLEIGDQPKTLQLVQRGFAGVLLAIVLKQWGSVLVEILSRFLIAPE